MGVSGAAQAAAASVVTRRAIVGPAALSEDQQFRYDRKMRYKRWLWWTRFGMFITLLQFVAALYLLCIFAKDLSFNATQKPCFLGNDGEGKVWKKTIAISFLVLVWLAVVIQCASGSDVLRWRSFYARHDIAWKAHYREVFDQGIREVFCCLGRVKYLSMLEEDEVYYVARLLGDLVAYRASGSGHLEFLAGLALLQKYKNTSISYNDLPEAPDSRLREAAFLHKFAEASYTGPLLDLGRNPLIFPCAWLHRQGFLTPWTRNRRPVIDGDNWWRGHAAAFLKYANVPPEALQYGRASRTKREAAYFIVVLHDVRTVVIAVRGTETPEDLITDGLCRDCTLSAEDLDGVINSNELSPQVRDAVLSSFPHFGHSGMVEYARELFMKIDGDSPSVTSGFLSSLMGRGCECYGYKLRIVGHSLGGSVATLLGLRLYRRYPHLHVYTYGALPCVDSVIAEACSNFVTSIVNNDEFSCRLSMNSVLRLRSAAFSALVTDSSPKSTLITNFAPRILQPNNSDENREKHLAPSPTSLVSYVEGQCNGPNKGSQLKYSIQGGAFLCGLAVSCMVNAPAHVGDRHKVYTVEESQVESSLNLGAHKIGASSQLEHNVSQVEVLSNFKYEPSGDRVDAHTSSDLVEEGVNGRNSDNLLSHENPMPIIMDESLYPTEALDGKFTELYLPGTIIHLVRIKKKSLSRWKRWRSHDNGTEYKAILADRNNFKDVIVSPFMFLDHLPWRCQYAMEQALKSRKLRKQSHGELHEEGMV